jgi:hypothetical protein
VVLQSEDGCKIFIIHATKAYGGIDLAPHILNEIMVSRQPHASAALITNAKLLVLLNRGLGGHHIPFGRFGEF